VAPEWPETTLEQVALPEGVVGGPFGSELVRADYTATGVPVIRGSNLGASDRRFNASEFVYVSREKTDALRRNLTVPGDIVVTQRGTLGQAAVVPDIGYEQFVISQSQMRLRCDPARADLLFVYYWLLLPETVRYVQRNAVAAGVPHINLGFFRTMRLRLPSIREQQAIASILGALDDKIELNRQMNETLEELARTIFKSWFVDFDPVRAKAEGHQPVGMDAETAALFPSRLVESELGEIPKGWDIGRLDDLLVLQRGFDLPTPSRQPGPYPVVAASGPTAGHVEARVQGPGVVTGRSGVLGRVFLVLEDFWPLNTALWVKEFRVARPHHAYFLLQGIDLAQFNAGSAVPTLNRNHVHGLRMVVPPLNVVERFEAAVAPLFLRRKHNAEESKTVAHLRDLLLPKLISGELRIPDAEKLVEDVA